MKIAVLGLGFMGSTHLKAMRNIPNAELVAVVSNDESKLAGDLSNIQGNLGGPGEKMDFTGVARYSSYEQALADPNVEAVDICLPTDLHETVTRSALRAGKHVLVEKPIALNGPAADSLVVEAQKQGRVLMTAQVLRFFPEYETAARMIKSSETGTVRTALFRRRCAAPGWSQWLANPAQSGGGVFDLLIHDVDYLLHVFGGPTHVSATGYENLDAGIDTIFAGFHYGDGKTILVTGGWHHPKAYPFSMEFTINADCGTLDYSSLGRPLTYFDSKGEAAILEVPAVDAFQAEIEYFLECAIAGEAPDRCPPAESAAAVKLALAMVESRKRNGETIPCRF
jgi:predicted dehydrogenase